MAVTKRAAKGTRLTIAEMDENFNWLTSQLSGSCGITGSLVQTGSYSNTGSIATNWMILNPVIGALPSSSAVPTGSLFISGSGATQKLYLWTGLAFFTASMSQI